MTEVSSAVRIGSKIRQRRQELGWSIVETAEKLGMEPERLEAIECGSAKTYYKLLQRLAGVLSTNPGYFVED